VSNAAEEIVTSDIGQRERESRRHPQTTIGGGFDHPFGSMGVALWCQGGGYDFLFYLFYFILFLKNNFF
jgi:hypothetical protein